MKYTILTVILLIVFLINPCKSQLIFRGSYGIIAMCKDGIIMGADSRSSIDTGDYIVRAYFDGNQKIYNLKDFSMLIIGQGSINRKTMPFYVNKFDSLVNHNLPLDRIAVQWYNFVLNTDSDYKYIDDFNKCAVFMVRYEHDTPKLCIPYPHFQGVATYVVDSIGYETDSSGFKNSYRYNYSFSKLASLIEQSIKNYAKHTKSEDIIGGQVYFITITKNNKISWYRKKPRKQLLTFKELWNGYKKKKIKMTFTSNENKILFENWFINNVR